MLEERRTDLGLWESVCRSEAEFVSSRMRFVQEAKDLEACLRGALAKPSQRGVALRLLLGLDVEVKKALFSDLVNLLSVAHSDITLAKQVVLQIPSEWVIEEIGDPVSTLLESGGGEEYLRIGEFLAELDKSLLIEHLRRASSHNDSAVRDIVEFFEADT